MKAIVLTIMALLIIAAIALCPLMSIWSLNTLFGLGIPYNLATWAAALWLTAAVVGNRASCSRS